MHNNTVKVKDIKLKIKYKRETLLTSARLAGNNFIACQSRAC